MVPVRFAILFREPHTGADGWPGRCLAAKDAQLLLVAERDRQLRLGGDRLLFGGGQR